MSERGEHLPSPELNNEQVASFLAAFGNNECKALTLIYTGDGDIYTKPKIHNAFIEAQGDSPVWNIAQPVPFGYCEVLADVGKVLEKTEDPASDKIGYTINALGRNRGIPLAGMLLTEVSQELDQSLYRLFGKTKSKSKESSDETRRSPYIRYKIFSHLVENQLPIRQIDLATGIEEHPSTVETHLQTLSEQDLILYDVPKVNNPYVRYAVSPNRENETPSTSYHYKRLTQKVWTALLENRGAFHTNWEYLQFILKIDPRLRKYDPERLTDDITRILSDLRNKGFAQVESLDGKFHSRINLTNDQKLKFSRVVEIVRAVQQGSETILNHGRENAESIIRNPSYVNQLLERAKRNSEQANAQPANTLIETVLAIVSSNRGLTSNEIKDRVEEFQKRKLSVARIQQILINEERKGFLRPETRGYVKHWYPSTVANG